MLERKIKLPEHPAIRVALEKNLKEADISKGKGYMQSGPKIRTGYAQEAAQLRHTLKTGEVTDAAVTAFYHKGIITDLHDKGTLPIDMHLERHGLQPEAALRFNAAVLQHYLRTKPLSKPHEKIGKAGVYPRQEHEDRSGVRLKQLYKKSLAESLAKMRQQPSTP